MSGLIVDADTHISSSRHDGLALLADDLLREMDRAGVDMSLIWLKPTYDKQIKAENRAVFKATRDHPDRFLGFGWTNPRLGIETAKDEISRCYEEYGLLGIKMNGAQDNYVIDDATISMPVIEYAAKLGKPIAFHIGADFYENTHPYRLRNIAEQFPETRFILIHIGGAAFPALDRAAIETAEVTPNIILVGSAIHERAILKAIEVVGPRRVCFGSDMPFFLMHGRLALYRAILRDYSEADVADILGNNIRRFLGVLEG